MPSPLILPLDSPAADLPAVGGKGANLAKLARAGFPVPGGFLVTASAYQSFVAANGLEERILALVPPGAQPDPAALESASEGIRALFSAGSLPAGLADGLRQAYAGMGAPPVAVRSSATAEDLPEMSFAGQQDTYLNVLGEDALLKAVVDCWASLWTARAIGYRSRNSVPHSGLALAVVVQQMVESQSSGVLFTANPLTGLRSQTVIDATLGLGEALVSGQVDPDHYVVDLARQDILSKTLGSKAVSIHGLAGGGTQHVQQDRAAVQALPDDQVLALAGLGRQVADLYGAPQDIEWAWAKDRLFLLQARPITSLYPVPEGFPAHPLKVFFSFGAVQGMLEPITPLGRNALALVFAAGSALFGIRVTFRAQTVLFPAGERLWANVTTILRNSVGRRIAPELLQFVEPTIRQAVLSILDEPDLQPGRSGISVHARLQLAQAVMRLGPNILLNLISPSRRRAFIVARGERLLKLMRQRSEENARSGDTPGERLALQADLLPGLAAKHLLPMFVLFISGVAAGVASWNFLHVLTEGIAVDDESRARREDLLMTVTRGIPYNPTTEMDLSLWEMAKIIRSDAPSMEAFQNNPSPALAACFRATGLPPVLQGQVARFLEKYGGRGLGEIDLGRSRWADDPTHVFEMLGSFLQIEDASLAPDVVFERGAVSARAAIDELVRRVRPTRHGWIKSRLARFVAGRARHLMGIRESPKFFAVRMFGQVRSALVSAAAEFVKDGALDQADDVTYLGLDEIKAFAAGEKRDWRALIAERRAVYQREQLRRQIPRLLLSDGRAFYEGLNDAAPAGDTITGSPVSPGSAEGNVRVVFDPRQAHLLPGEILVCPGTDPSWTPLFLSAAGLVMETGGMMTHGAVVAREYGIPAIVGVDKATTRLKTGQRIRVDGSTGRIHLLDDDA